MKYIAYNVKHDIINCNNKDKIGEEYKMLTIKGKYNEAIVYASNIDERTISQIEDLCNEEIYKDEKIRVMADCHSGSDCIVGLTMTVTNKVNPSLVGTDIGCGISALRFPSDTKIDLKLLGEVCKDVAENTSKTLTTRVAEGKTLEGLISNLRCLNSISLPKAYGSFGTVGGGNHFVELGRNNETGEYYLFCHTGSRNLGGQVGNYYINLAYRTLKAKGHKEEVDKIINKLKSEGRESEISKEIAKFKKENPLRKYTKGESYLEGKDLEDYLHDMVIAQEVSKLNRAQILEEIREKALGVDDIGHIECIHNYIEVKEDANGKDKKHILRKGSISSNDKEEVLIPINMKEGVIIGVGKGNEDWNYSAPHGAGRVLSRTQAKEKLDMETYKKEMEGIYTTCISEETLDEAPGAYKSIEDIISCIGDSVDVIGVIKPIFNYKSGEDFTTKLKLKAMEEKKRKRELRELNK